MRLVLLLVPALNILAGPSALEEAKKTAEEGPIDFVCTSMQLFSQPNRAVCRQDVVLRRGDLLLCCQELEGYMNEKGGWERLVCSQQVRAQRHDELMWAERATFVVETHDLILSGHPLLQRGKSILSGDRIVVDTKLERAHIEQPRGRLEPAAQEPPPASQLPLSGDLPRRCPIPAAPAGSR